MKNLSKCRRPRSRLSPASSARSLGCPRGAGYLAAEHGHLVPEHDDFERQFFGVAPEEPE